MDLMQKFQAANAYRHINIPSLEIGRPYPISYAKRVQTRYGSVVMVLRDIRPLLSGCLYPDVTEFSSPTRILLI
jgi:hypothetical protein